MNFDTKKAILVSFFTQNFIPEWFELENDVRCQVNHNHLSLQTYTNPEEFDLEFFRSHKNVSKEKKLRWVLNASQFRVNGRYGRNIKTRYATSAK